MQSDSAPSTHLLVIDDEEAIRKPIARLLDRSDPSYEVHIAATPDEAISKFGMNPIQLCLIDQNLKAEMTGIDLAGHLKTKDENIKIIMLTGESNSQVVLDALNSSVIDSFLTKPFEIDELLDYVRKNLEMARKQQEKTSIIIQKIRSGEPINDDEIALISKDMGHLESLMFDFRLTKLDETNEYIYPVALVIFDSEEILYTYTLKDNFSINDEFMFRGLISSLSNLSEELFELQEEGSTLDEIKLPNLHAKVSNVTSEYTVVVFINGQSDIPPVINKEITRMFKLIKQAIMENYNQIPTDRVDEIFDMLLISLKNYQSK